MMLKRNGLFLAAFLLSAGSAQAYTIAAGCAVPSTAAATRTLYVDPTKGNDANSGAQSAPWKSIQAANIKAGDTVFLMSGNYGDVHLDGIKLASFATIKPYPSAVPVFATMTSRGSSHLRVQGVKFQSLSTPDTIYTALIDIGGNAFWGASDNIVIDQNNVSSADDSSSWTQADWRAKARWIGISTDGGDEKSTYAHCVSITNNTIKNVKYGLSAGSDDTLVESNTLDNYGDDGFDFAGNRVVIHNNRLTNNRDIGDANHNDGMQGQIGRGVIDASGKSLTTYDGVVLDGNYVNVQTDPALKFPGDLQGVDAFDMSWSHMTITNNVVITNSWHGLSFYSISDSLIANNTVLGTNPAAMAWLLVANLSHEGTVASHNVVVRNNIASTYSIEPMSSVLTFDHNLSGGLIALTDASANPVWNKTPGTYGDHNVIDKDALAKTFVKFDIVNKAYDVHLLAGSLAIGTGNSPAPAFADGTARVAPIDLGAYAFSTAGTNPTPVPTPVPTPTPTPVPTPVPTPTPVTGVTIVCKAVKAVNTYTCVFTQK